jgi:hypothetical protein
LDAPRSPWEGSSGNTVISLARPSITSCNPEIEGAVGNQCKTGRYLLNVSA